jgi:tetratricopeptide (TPR) repeat protein
MAARDDAERRAVYRAMAVCHIDRGRRTEALALLWKSAQLAEKAGDHAAMSYDVLARGDVLLDAGKTAPARQEFVRVLALARQSNIPDRYKKSRELLHRGELALVAAAEKDFATANSEAEAMRAGFEGWANTYEKFRIHEVLGIVALRQGKWDESIAQFTQADQKSPWVMFHIAKAYEGKQDRETALTWYRKAATTYVLPNIMHALVRQASLRAAAGDTKGPS